MNERRFCGLVRSCAMVLVFSLIFGSTNLLVYGSIGASSPEEKRHANDLSLSGPLPSETKPLVDFKAEIPGAIGASAVASPLLTAGLYTYKPNPISGLIAAALTMAMMTLKESGRVDLEGLGYILNSTDYYAGVLGLVNGLVAHKGVNKVGEFVLNRGMAASPNVLKPLLTAKVTQQIGNIVNGFLYTFMVSGGFEYFSQIWKHATKNIPEAHTVTGFIRSDSLRKKQVALNLLYLLVMDTALQKKILSSVYNHRILTFEFIAINVGLYVGGQVGYLLSQKYGGGTPWLQKIGPTIGSISGGMLVQAIPSSWAKSANQGIVDWRIQVHRKALENDLKRIKEGIKNRYYPDEENSKSGYWVSGADLQADVERVLADRDMIASLEIQRMSYRGATVDAQVSLKSTFDTIQNTFESLLHEVQSDRVAGLQEQIDKWLKENRSSSEIRSLTQGFSGSASRLRYYEILLDAATDRSYEATRGAQGVVEILGKKKLDPTDLSVFGFGQ